MNSKWRSVWALVAGGILFAVAHTQAPLYFSNQHQYFVQGAAAADQGNLEEDWLANTLDPTPLFSASAELIYRDFHENLFQLIYFLLLVVYFVSLMSIGCWLIPKGPQRTFRLAMVGCLLIVIHAGALRLASVRLLGIDYSWYFQSGLAGQYALGPGLQPSAFGALLIASVAAFLHGRLTLAIVCSSFACLVHATYLLPAAMLTSAYMFVLRREGRSRAALLLGIGSFLGVTPVVWYSATTFAPSSPDAFQETQKLLAEFRIPHHALVDRWLDIVAAIQISWMALAMVLVRKTRLFPLLAIPAAFGVILTLIQVATGNLTLALLFPWRISIVLMPLATCIIFSNLASLLPERRWMWGTIVAASLAAVVGGVVIMTEKLAYPSNDLELPALIHVRDHKQPKEVYLLPISVPKVGSARGSVSLSFTPPPQEKHLIRVDLQRFRLFTGAPIYVDFKSIPYKDTDVLEWRRRLDRCEEWYKSADWDNPSVHEELRKERITHVVTPADKPIVGTGYEEVFADSAYRIYRLQSAGPQDGTLKK